MDKINPLIYITDTDPVPEEVLDASGWFETEYITTTVSTGVGLVAAADMTDYLPWFLAQGWVHYDTGSQVLSVNPPVTRYIYYLKRRKMQSERVLNDMIREFTEAHNEGRTLNDQRYDEIVKLYSVMLDKTEDEISSLNLDPDDYEGLVDLLSSDFTTFDSSSSGMLDTYGTSQRDRVNLQFDNESAAARQALINRGMYNSTVWTSASAGIERRRAEALNDLEDKILLRRTALLESNYDRKVKVRLAVMQSHDRLLALRKEGRLAPLDMRNTILTAMLNFMERRSDEYPGLDNLAGIVSQLGYAEGGTVVAP